MVCTFELEFDVFQICILLLKTLVAIVGVECFNSHQAYFKSPVVTSVSRAIGVI